MYSSDDESTDITGVFGVDSDGNSRKVTPDDQIQPTDREVDVDSVFKGHNDHTSDAKRKLQVAIAIDTSPSMREADRIGNAKKQTQKLLETMFKNNPTALASVLVFDDNVRQLRGQVDHTSVGTLIYPALAELKTAGEGTALYDATLRGLDTLRHGAQDHKGCRSALVVLTDGADNSSTAKATDVMRVLGEPGFSGLMVTFVLLNALPSQVDVFTTLCSFVHTKLVLVSTTSNNGLGIEASFQSVGQRIENPEAGEFEVTRGAWYRCEPDMTLLAPTPTEPSYSQQVFCGGGGMWDESDYDDDYSVMRSVPSIQMEESEGDADEPETTHAVPTPGPLTQVSVKIQAGVSPSTSRISSPKAPVRRLDERKY